MAVDAGTVHDPDTRPARVGIDQTRFGKLLAGIKELLPRECALGNERASDTEHVDEDKQRDPWHTVVFALIDERLAFWAVSCATEHASIVEGDLVKKDNVGLGPLDGRKFAGEAQDIGVSNLKAGRETGPCVSSTQCE